MTSQGEPQFEFGGLKTWVNAESVTALAPKQRFRLHRIMPGKIDESIGRTAVQDLKDARRLHGLSRPRVAAVLGCSPVTLKFWESGRRKPSRISAHWIAALASKITRDGELAINGYLGFREF